MALTLPPGLANVRYYLLKIRDTKAYIALGYETFEAFGTAEFGYEKVYLYRLSNAAEIEQNLELPLGNSPIPERHLRPLAQVPEEERQAIWDEATRIAEESGQKLNAKLVEEAFFTACHQLPEFQQLPVCSVAGLYPSLVLVALDVRFWSVLGLLRCCPQHQNG